MAYPGFNFFENFGAVKSVKIRYLAKQDIWIDVKKKMCKWLFQEENNGISLSNIIVNY